MSRFIPDSIKYGSLVAKAAADDEVPTAGYLQEELKKMTLDPDSCTGVEDALLARLEKRSSNVKLKTLRLIKMLCESGSPSFRRDLQRRIKEVRECLHWQGEPHPTMGDLPNKMVRETAQQVSTLHESNFSSFFYPATACVNSCTQLVLILHASASCYGAAAAADAQCSLD